MHQRFRPVAAWFGAACLAVALASASGSAAFAQAKSEAETKPSPEAAAPSQPAFKEITLTEKQVAGVLAAHKDVDAVAAKLPDDPQAKPDPKIIQQLDAAAKKHGFADYGDYSEVVETISMVMAGVDAKTKTYVGPEAELKAQIAIVEADPKMSAEDKKLALADLNEALKSPGPTVKNQTNIDLVLKNYDKLVDALEEDE
ncbi:conserved hypothetical protein [Rhodopseudomonas palustris HaA2]|uniref:Uncharacterized protein n=1 Tax=Rhodopseudomonas palustris (strain HaA2) TaxID=316058 RepID=Q2IS79_RHOP2|nr:hypothetical protein [Rhodopseudomonas palustris]ABD08931.1 conserved hypothetical protein [Rhodopseudomonas palustris HaA2]